MKNKKKILFVLHMPPPVHGAAMVGKYIHDSRVVNGAFRCKFINMGLATSLEDIGRGGIGKYLRYLGIICKTVLGVVCWRPKLVYVTPTACGGGFYKDFVLVETVKLLGGKVVVHFHNKGVATRQDRKLDDWMYRRFFKGIKVILLAEALYDDVRKYVKRENVFICPNGIPETLTAEPSAERHNPVPRLLFLSNLLVDKGVLVLLDALKLLKDKGYSFICDFVGGETAEIDAARFEREVEERGLNEMVLYLGKKYGEEKNEEYASSDLFVAPSMNEAFPLVNLEAMEFKLPVVASDVGGVSAEVKDGENGFLCTPGDTDGLTKSIIKILDNSNLRIKMGEDGYRKFKENFTLKAFENKMVEGLRFGGVS